MSREHPLAYHRVVVASVIVILAVATVLAVRGPRVWQRLYHPLRYEDLIEREARANGLDPYLVAALINAESGFDPTRVSHAGAVGLMQVLPSTAQEVAAAFGIEQRVDAEALKDPELNIRVGTRHLADLLARYRDEATAIAAYNAGAGNVDRWIAEQGGSTLTAAGFPETRAYVERVLTEKERYRKLYPDAFER